MQTKVLNISVIFLHFSELATDLSSPDIEGIYESQVCIFMKNIWRRNVLPGASCSKLYSRLTQTMGFSLCMSFIEKSKEKNSSILRGFVKKYFLLHKQTVGKRA
jgi:hypothetical protein